MTGRQKIALIAPLILMAVMYPIFQLWRDVFETNWRISWYCGLASYWLLWGAIFPWWLIGKEGIRRVFRHQKLNLWIFLLVLFPLLMTFFYKNIGGMVYEKPDVLIFLLVVSSAFGNGIFEEVFWRGVYMALFPDNLLWRMVWPSVWFSLWHYLPGSMSPTGNVWGLMAGAAIMGFYWSFMAKKTGTIWWGIIAHIIGGLIVIA
jgi:membrane protease YdiL (CAAX protease family)